MSTIASSTSEYTTDDAREGAAQFAQDIADEVLSEFEIQYETAGYVGKKAMSFFKLLKNTTVIISSFQAANAHPLERPCLGMQHRRFF